MSKGFIFVSMVFILIISFTVTPHALAQNKLVLVEHGRSDYKIVIPWGASPSEKYEATFPIGQTSPPITMLII